MKSETQLILEAAINKEKHHYLGQCDKLRCDQRGEDKWQNMMKDKIDIPFNLFKNSVDASPILDDGETLDQWYQNAKASDPTTQTYRSHWGDQDALFVQTAGFEFIFV